MRLTLVTLVSAAFTAMTAAAHAEPPKVYGDAVSGKGFALLKCSGCHAIEKNAKVSPNIKAPPFSVIAKSKMITAREVEQWLSTAHQDMPDFKMDGHIRGDLIAYFRSLSPKEPME